MKKLFVLIALVVFCLTGPLAFADTWVNGYYRSDGTYVQGHYRSSPNQYRYDNYSARGNYNPYTGQIGSKRHEFTSPPAYNKSYSNYGNSYGNYGNGYGNSYGNGFRY